MVENWPRYSRIKKVAFCAFLSKERYTIEQIQVYRWDFRL